jgi:steroid 5-alpha reductase family enzyme
MHNDAAAQLLDAAIAVFALSIIGEAIADRQLARFRSDPANRGEVCRVGLWRYSRHPNYFFEWLHWFAYPLLAIGRPVGVGPCSARP